MRIIADIFPADFSGAAADVLTDVNDLNPITTNDPRIAYVATTRIIVTETHVSVASDSPQGPSIVFHEPYAQFFPPKEKNGVYRAILKSGKFVAFQKDDACGCGTRLRSWNPYKTLNSINDPTE
jgi:hypothetical protein